MFMFLQQTLAAALLLCASGIASDTILPYNAASTGCGAHDAVCRFAQHAFGHQTPADDGLVGGDALLQTGTSTSRTVPINEPERYWSKTWAWAAASHQHVPGAPVAEFSARVAVAAVQVTADAHPMFGETPLARTESIQTAGPAGRLVVSVTLEVETSLIDYADTNTGLSAAFEVGGVWTQEVLLCNRAAYGEVLWMPANLSQWPSKFRIKALGPDAYAYNTIKLHWGRISVTVLSATDGSFEYGPDSPHWVDSNEAAPVSSVYDVPEISYQPPVIVDAAEVNCTTQEEARASSFGYTTAEPGTTCVFGVDVRDEGSHCIIDGGQYGSYGWCYTNEDGGTWGSCSKNCPLSGPLKILGDKVDGVQELIVGANRGPEP